MTNPKAKARAEEIVRKIPHPIYAGSNAEDQLIAAIAAALEEKADSDEALRLLRDWHGAAKTNDAYCIDCAEDEPEHCITARFLTKHGMQP